MKYESIADIFSANRKMHEGLEIVLGGVSPDEATAVPEGGGWSIQQIVEHIAIVNGAALRICGQLLDQARAENKPSDGSFTLSKKFDLTSAEAMNVKIEAPERVRPTSAVPIPASMLKMTEIQAQTDALQPDMERLDLGDHTFPHPFFGDLNAAEWLVIAGGHEMRHTLQIQAVLERVRR